MRPVVRTLLLTITLAICAWFFADCGKESYPFYGDSMGYYLYLPSTFIYHSHKALNWLPADKHYDKSIRSYLATLKSDVGYSPRGYIVNKYTYGVAAMELPFFLIAHGYEKITGGEANGYSAAYRWMVKMSSLFYALLGLLVLYRILKSFFSPALAITGTIAILLGTNLFWFALFQSGMAHVPLFFLYAALIYATILLHKKPGIALFVLAGLLAGLITVIRPVDIICLLIPLLYNVYSRETLRQKIVFLKAQRKNVLIFAAASVLPLLPQMLYWKKFAGTFLYYSYGRETFNWLRPEIIKGLFSFTNGWLVYSPLMLFSLLGLMCYRQIKPVAILLYLLVPAYIYIVYSWYCYNYINGLGSRPMIHLYPLLAIPFTAVLQYVGQRKAYLKAVFACVVLFFISVNISYSIQQAKGILLSEESTAVYNLHMLFKTRADYADLVTFDVGQVQPVLTDIEPVAAPVCVNYDDSLSADYVKDPTAKSGFAYHMPAGEEYHSRTITLPYDKAVFKNAEWVKCSGRFMCTTPTAYFKHLLILDILRGGQSVSWSGCKIDNKIGLAEPGAAKDEFVLSHSLLRNWGAVYFFIRVPADVCPGDVFRLSIWNIGKQEMFCDDLCLGLYRQGR